MNNISNMTCMNSNQFKASISCSSEPNLSKTRCKHGLLPKHGHACKNPWRTTSRMQEYAMHATIKLLFNNNEPKSLEAQESCMNKLKHNNERLNSLPRASITSVEVQLGKSLMISSSLSSQFSRTIQLSPFLSLYGRLNKEKGLMKCFDSSIQRFNKCEVVATKWSKCK